MDLQTFLASVSPDDLILTANRRLAAYLKQQYDESQLAQNKTTWAGLTVLPFSTWLEKLWDDYSGDTRVVMTDFQELLLWEDIILNSDFGPGLLNPNATAKLVKNTWKLVQHWLLKTSDIAKSSSLDVQTFLQWSKQFQVECKRHHMLSRAEVMPLCVAKIENKSINFLPARQSYLLGFDDLVPAAKILQESLSLRSIDLQIQVPSTVHKSHFINLDHELKTMARWAFNVLRQNPQAKIGCISPNLSSLRDKLSTVFEQEFLALNSDLSDQKLPVNISGADSLNSYAIIQTALTILSLNFVTIDFTKFSYLLTSSYIRGSESELHTRAKLDVKLRSLNEMTLDIDALIKSNPDLFKANPILLQTLNSFRTLKSSAQESHELLIWADIFSRQLNIMGWPGERTLNSLEFQLVERFKKSLAEFATLDELSHIQNAAPNFSQAFSLLKKLTAETLFQPKTTSTPIQVLGILEATGMQFDFVWLAGLDNETWPPPASPNPFLPFALQKKYGLPHSTAQRELDFSSSVTARLQQNASQIICSYTMTDGDRELAPSTLIANLPDITLEDLDYPSVEQQIYATKNMERFVDDHGPPLTATTIRGGSGIFKSQAACPFQAFALYRLQARPLEDVEIGLAAHERGSLIHDILAQLWRKLKNHSHLCSLNDDDLIVILRPMIENSLQQFKLLTLHPRFIELETTRLLKLLINWLRLEKERQPFSVVSCELRQAINVGGLQIDVQTDRIDTLEDNSHIVIDYKTGKTSLQDWFGDRPKEPQLPLYAIMAEGDINGILFAQLRGDDLCFKGITAYSDIAPGGVTIDRIKLEELQSWQDIKHYWQKILLHLADAFAKGDARVDPRDVTACQYCHLHELCRIKQKNNAQELNHD